MKIGTLLSGILIAAASFASSHAQTYPDRYVTVVAPFPPGGSSDTVMRIMQAKFAEFLGQNVIIESRPGANGSTGAGQVARAAPDGYTLLIASIGVYAINPVLYAKLPYDPLKDFELLSQAVRTPNILVANPNFPASNVKELVEYLKKNPGKVTFGSSGIGSSDHLTTELFWQKTGTSGIHVPYRGSGPAISDVVAGHASVLFMNFGLVSQQIESGQLKALAVTTEKRLPDYPNIPTIAEAGVEDLVVYSWQGIAVPKKTPTAVLDKLQPAIIKSLNDPGVQKRFAEIGFDVVASTPAEFAAFLKGELARWDAVVKAAKIKLD